MLPELIEKIHPDRTWWDTFDIWNNEEKRDADIKQAKNVITGGKGLDKYKDLQKINNEQDTYWYRVKRAVPDYLFAHYSFEWAMNALGRKDNTTGHRENPLIKRWANKAHRANQKKEKALRLRQAEVAKALAESYGITSSKGIRHILAQIAETQKTGIFVNSPEHDSFILTLEQAEKMIIDYNTDSLEGVYKDLDWTPDMLMQLSDGIDRIRKNIYMNREYINEIKVEYVKDIGTQYEIECSQLEALQYYLMAQQENVKLRNMVYNGWTEDSFKQLDKFLDESTLKFGEWLMNKYDEQYEPMNQVYKQLFYFFMLYKWWSIADSNR